MDLFGKKSKKRLLELESEFSTFKNQSNQTIDNLNSNINSLNQELDSKKLKINKLSLQKKLIQALFSNKSTNKGVANYKKYLNNDFLEFANYEESLSNEAEAIIKLQTIEKSLR